MSEGGSGFLDKVKGVIKGSGKKTEEKWIPIDVDQAIKDNEKKNLPFKEITEIKPVGGKGDSLFLGSFTPIDMPKVDVVSGFTPIEMPAGESINDVYKSGLEGVVVGDNEKVVKKESNENLIDPEILNVLARVPEEVPIEFKDSLVKVASWWTRLDKGDASVLQDGEARNWLARFLGNTGVTIFRDSSLSFLKKDLPWWLRKEHTDKLMMESDRNFDVPTVLEVKRIEENFEKWGNIRGYRVIDRGNGKYLITGNKDKERDLSNADSYKIYLEKDVEKVLNEGSLDTVLGVLSDRIPSQMKTLDGFLFFYFNKRDLPGDEVVKIFRENGLNVSDWVQDVYEIDVDGELDLLTSNDSAVRFMEYPERYESGDMFKRYVDYCLRAARKPDNPIRAAFVRAKCEKGEEKEKVLLPVVYSKEPLRVRE